MSAQGSIVEQLGLGKYTANGATKEEAPPAAQEAAPAETEPAPAAKANPVPKAEAKPTKVAKKRATKKKRGRKPAVASQLSEGSLLGNLSSQLAEIHKEADAVEKVNAAKAELRSAKAQLTQLKKFAAVVTSSCEAVEKRIAELEAQVNPPTEDTKE